MGELSKRIAFSVIAIPITVGIIYLGGAALAALLAIIAALGTWELFRMAKAGGIPVLARIGIPLAGILPLLVHARYLGAAHGVTGDMTGPPRMLSWLYGMGWTEAAVAVLVLLAASIWVRGVTGRPLASVATTVFGVVYVAGMLSFGYAIRYHDYAVGARAGTALVFLPLILTWGTDTGAYAVGRAIGRRKLIPSVSPGKTIEGAVGGLAVAVIFCWIYVTWVLRPSAQLALSPLSIIVFGVVVSAAGQIGDLAESLLKREAGVKDSSHIIPGHGGILDRFDSLLFVLPVAYLLLNALLQPARA